jgi:hypothetical protein
LEWFVCLAMHEMRITVYGRHGAAICRDVRVPSLLAMLTAISAAVRDLETRLESACTYAVVQLVCAKSPEAPDADLQPGDIQIVNMCGRVTHYATADCVISPACRSLMWTARDSFGLRSGIFTVFGNFMTSEKKTTTLFRGAKRSSEVAMIAEHVFAADSIQQIVMHMLVAKARLPCAVVVLSTQIERALLSSDKWSMREVSSSEDMAYMKALELRFADGRGTKVLLHVYNSGIIFFFVTCPRTALSEQEELRVVCQCGEVYKCIEAVV